MAGRCSVVPRRKVGNHISSSGRDRAKVRAGGGRVMVRVCSVSRKRWRRRRVIARVRLISMTAAAAVAVAAASSAITTTVSRTTVVGAAVARVGIGAAGIGTSLGGGEVDAGPWLVRCLGHKSGIGGRVERRGSSGTRGRGRDGDGRRLLGRSLLAQVKNLVHGQRIARMDRAR